VNITIKNWRSKYNKCCKLIGIESAWSTDTQNYHALKRQQIKEILATWQDK